MTAPFLSTTTSKLILASAIACALLAGCNKHNDANSVPAATHATVPGTTPATTPDTVNPDGTTTPPNNGTTPATGTGTPPPGGS